jgi:hypothetical protein
MGNTDITRNAKDQEKQTFVEVTSALLEVVHPSE